jgi:prepilin-type N-terminal cleavage/methylation domain-containing protein
MRRDARWWSRGFTLVEAVIVVSVVALALAFSFAGVRGAVRREQVDGWAKSMTYDIAAGRQAALTYRNGVNVTVTSSGYTIALQSGRVLRAATLPSDIVLTTSCPSSVCAFNKRGVPTAAGTVTVTSTATGRTYTITIQSGTGRVSYSGG